VRVQEKGTHMRADGDGGSREQESSAASLTARFTRLKSDVERESHLTYKVRVLFLARLGKQEAWQILLKVHPGFNEGTLTIAGAPW